MILNAYPDGLPKAEVHRLVAERVTLSEHLRQTSPSHPKRPRFHTFIGTGLSCEVAARWVTKQGTWKLTDLGREALSDFSSAQKFHAVACRKYREKRKHNPKGS
jgi:hypothetical protein